MSKTPKLRFKEFSGDWEEKKLDEFLTESKIKGSTGAESKKLTVKLWGKGIIPKKETLQGSSETQYYIRKAGQLMYGKLDFLNCAFGIVPEHLDGYESTLDAPAFDIKNANGNFLLLKIIQKNFYKKYGEIADGSRKAKRVHVGTFLDMPITIPSLEEQEKIASFISLIDDKISLQGEKVEALKDYKKGMMQKIFSRELRFKDDEGRDYPEWEEKKLGDIANLTSSKRVFASDYVDEGIPFYRGKEITELKQNKKPNDILYITQEKYDDIKNNFGIPVKGDLLLTAVGTLGNSYVIKDDNPFYFKDGNLIWFKDIKEDVNFLNFILTSEKGQKKIIDSAIGSTQKALTIVELNKLKYEFPSLKEQRKIAKFLNGLESKVMKEQEKLDFLNEYKKGLLQQMFV